MRLPAVFARWAWTRLKLPGLDASQVWPLRAQRQSCDAYAQRMTPCRVVHTITFSISQLLFHMFPYFFNIAQTLHACSSDVLLLLMLSKQLTDSIAMYNKHNHYRYLPIMSRSVEKTCKYPAALFTAVTDDVKASQSHNDIGDIGDIGRYRAHCWCGRPRWFPWHGPHMATHPP